RAYESSMYFWSSRTKQMRGSTCSFSCGRSPKTVTVPEVGQSWPDAIDMSEVLPAPLRPRRPWMTPSCSDTLTPSSAMEDLCLRVRSVTSMALFMDAFSFTGEVVGGKSEERRVGEG